MIYFQNDMYVIERKRIFMSHAMPMKLDIKLHFLYNFSSEFVEISYDILDFLCNEYLHFLFIHKSLKISLESKHVPKDHSSKHFRTIKLETKYIIKCCAPWVVNMFINSVSKIQVLQPLQL